MKLARNRYAEGTQWSNCCTFWGFFLRHRKKNPKRKQLLLRPVGYCSWVQASKAETEANASNRRPKTPNSVPPKKRSRISPKCKAPRTTLQTAGQTGIKQRRKNGIPHRRIAPPARRAWPGTRASPAAPSPPPLIHPPALESWLPLSQVLTPQFPSSHLPKTEGMLHSAFFYFWGGSVLGDGALDICGGIWLAAGMIFV